MGLNIILAGLALGLTGCVSKVTQDNPDRPPAYRDRIEAQYQQPAQKVFEAAKRAFNRFGNITVESSSVSSAVQMCFIEGTINQDKVYIRIEGTSSSAAKMIVQIRAPMGGTNLQVANELQKQTELELPRR
jgi:hypothetical protein